MRRYLDAVFGNRDSCRALGESIEKNALSHALLIEGGNGSGKHTLAKEIAKALLCENGTDKNVPLPCSSCRACHLVENNLAPDVHFISRGDRATLGVDAVREMIKDTAMASTEFDHKIYIFEDAHTMTAGAQNALLKIMEEPPKGVTILLLTESADNMLTTVRSRARLLRMQRFTREDIFSYLSQQRQELILPYQSKKEELDELLMLSDGSIGSAMRLLTPESAAIAKSEREETLAVLSALSQKSYATLHKAISALPQKREEMKEALLMLQNAVCDLILHTRAEEPPFSFFPSSRSIPEHLTAMRISTLFAFHDAIETTIEELDRNANIQMTVTMLTARLRNAQKER